MSETKDEATARGWSGKPAGGVEVRQTVAPLPTASGGAAAAPAERPQSAAKAKAPVIAADSGYAVFFFPAESKIPNLEFASGWVNACGFGPNYLFADKLAKRIAREV